MHSRLTSAPALAAALLAAAALMGCSSSTSQNASGSSTSLAESTTTAAPATSAPASTAPAPTTAAPAPTVAPPAPPASLCDDIAPTAAAVDVTVVNGDWNGDGAVDSAVSWGEPTSGGVDWFVRMQLSGAGNSSIFLGDLGPGYARVTGRVDVDYSLGAPAGSNEDELVAVVGSSAAGFNLGVFGLDRWGCLFQFDNGGGDVYIIPVYNSMLNISGMTCDGGMGSRFVVRLEATSADGTNWTTSDIRVQRDDDNSLAEAPAIIGALTSASPALNAYGTAECDGTSLMP